jgi:deazaflavin-dependent oxidoreductase (nitroreductase family)
MLVATEALRPGGRRSMSVDIRAINPMVIEQFRAGGEIKGMHRDRLLLLTTVGARTGTRHTTPMMFHRDDDGLFVVASNAGAPRHPSWYHNLIAHPRVTVEVGDETFEAVATPLVGEERRRVWATLTAAYPFFADHEAAIDREIPVVRVTKV